MIKLIKNIIVQIALSVSIIIISGCRNSDKIKMNSIDMEDLLISNIEHYSNENYIENHMFEILNSTIILDSVIYDNILIEYSYDRNNDRDILTIFKRPVDILHGSRICIQCYFTICIKKNNTLIVEDEELRSETLDNTIWHYIESAYNHKLNIDYYSDSIPYFGIVKIPTIPFILYADVIGNNGLNDEEWNMFFNSIDVILNIYDKYRDKISKDMFNCEFRRLPFDKQDAILKYFPLGIILHFNKKCETFDEMHSYPEREE